MSWLIPIVASYLPALPSLRRVGFGAALLAVVAGGAWLVWTLRHQDEAPRIERAARAIVERKNLEAEVEVLQEAIELGTKTLALREQSLAKSKAELAALQKEQEDKRHASANPDAVCIPAGDPWFGPLGLRQ